MMNVYENVAFGLRRRGEKGAAVDRKVRDVLERVGLPDAGEKQVSQLSGGQKQRIAIARALFNQPKLLLCDEPTGNLDSRTGQQIIDLFTTLNREDGITLVIVTHESRVSSAAHRVVRLEDGRVTSTSGPIGVDAAAQAAAASTAGAAAAEGGSGAGDGPTVEGA